MTDLKKIHLEKCDQIGDGLFSSLKWSFINWFLGTISRFKQVKDSLESVALIDLAQISENGLGNLTDLKYVKKRFYFYSMNVFRNLRQIDLARLPGIRNREGIIKLLKNELPKCTVNYDDNYPPAPELQEK